MKPLVFKAQTEWVKPTEFPDLTQAETIAIDLETCDPDLKTSGSGAVVGRGKVVGIAVAVDGYCGYFPFDHVSLSSHKTYGGFYAYNNMRIRRLWHFI